MKRIAVDDCTKNKTDFWRRYLVCLIPPVGAMVLGLIVYFVYRLFPFSGDVISWGDMSQQSIPLLLDLKRILSGQFDLFLNTANAGGMDFWGVCFFFVSSPLNLLIALIPTHWIYWFANLFVLIKISVAAFTASLFFRRHFRSLTAVQVCVLSGMYAFCGFAMLYYQNIIWLDMMWVFPILLMGVLDLLEKQRIALYCIALSCTVMINYYLSYMVVIFLVLCFGVFTAVAAPKANRKGIIARFLFASLIAALLTAVFWAPSLLQYMHSGRTTNIMAELITSEVLTTLATTVPVVLCTATVAAILPIFFWSGLFRDRKAVAFFVLEILTLIPVILEPINKMWHTGSYQAFPVRYGYISVMIGLCLTAKFLSRTNEQHRQIGQSPEDRSPLLMSIVWLLILAFCSVAVIMLLREPEVLALYVHRLWVGDEQFVYLLLFGGMAAVVYFLIYLLYHNRMMSSRWCSVMLCVVTVCEIFFNSSVFLGSAARSSWRFENALDLSDRLDNEEELFRTKLNQKYFDVNLVGALGYNTTSHYTSLTDQDFMFAMKKLGYSSYWMEIGSNGGTALTDLLLANRYTILKNVETTATRAEKVYEGLIYCMTENPKVQSFGTTFRKADLSGLETLPQGTRMELQQFLSDLFFDSGSIVTSYQPLRLDNVRFTATDGTTAIKQKNQKLQSRLVYSIPVKEARALYLDCFDQISNSLKEAVNDSFLVRVNGVQLDASFPSQSNNGLLYLGTFRNTTVKVELLLRKNVQAASFGVYGVDEAAVYEAAAKKIPTTLRRSGNTISGTVTAMEADEWLFLPMSFDKGYRAEINGEPAEIHRILDTFMAIKIPKGESTLTMTYVPAGFRWGLILSLLGVLSFVLAMIMQRRRWFRWIRWSKHLLYPLFWAALCGVFLVIYVLPMAINLTKYFL